MEAQGINSKSWLFVLTEKQTDHVVSLHNTEIQNDATQLRCGSTIISERKGCTKSVIMQAGGNRIYMKEDKLQTPKCHLKRSSKQSTTHSKTPEMLG